MLSYKVSIPIHLIITVFFVSMDAACGSNKQDQQDTEGDPSTSENVDVMNPAENSMTPLTAETTTGIFNSNGSISAKLVCGGKEKTLKYPDAKFEFANDQGVTKLTAWQCDLTFAFAGNEATAEPGQTCFVQADESIDGVAGAFATLESGKLSPQASGLDLSVTFAGLFDVDQPNQNCQLTLNASLVKSESEDAPKAIETKLTEDQVNNLLSRTVGNWSNEKVEEVIVTCQNDTIEMPGKWLFMQPKDASGGSTTPGEGSTTPGGPPPKTDPDVTITDLPNGYRRYDSKYRQCHIDVIGTGEKSFRLLGSSTCTNKENYVGTFSEYKRYTNDGIRVKKTDYKSENCGYNLQPTGTNTFSIMPQDGCEESVAAVTGGTATVSGDGKTIFRQILIHITNHEVDCIHRVSQRLRKQ